MMKILLLESFYTSSHKQWADSLLHHSEHQFDLLQLPGRHWKWRMHHAARYFAEKIKALKKTYDVFLCSDFLNIAELKGLLYQGTSQKKWYHTSPFILYFHENQITYPWSSKDPDPALQRDNHYGWVNYISALSSDYVVFNSHFHKDSFVDALPAFLKQFPKSPESNAIEAIKVKSSVLPIALELNTLTTLTKPENPVPIVLWNHRWEYDKGPETFFNSLFILAEKNVPFNLIIAGEHYNNYPTIFDLAKEKLGSRILHFGYASSKDSYHKLLQQSDFIPITSNQDFFGIAAVEAIAAGCIPLLPKRLAFPEHLSHPDHGEFYYNDSEELTFKLERLLTKSKRESTELRSHILKYDVSQVIPMYDQFISQILSR